MESVSTASEDPVLYLFGFVARPRSIQPVEGMEPGSQVVFVESGDLACAASPVSLRAFSATIDASSPEHAEWLGRHAWRHHEILSRLHASATVLPLKFGTLCPDATVARGILEERHATIASLLDRFAGLDEWTLRICLDEEGIASRLERESPELLRMQAAEAALPEGHAYFARRMRLKTTAGLVARVVAGVHAQVLDRLSGLGIEMAKNGGGAALLVDRERFEGVREALRTLESEHADCGAAFELVGPWPPYSFVPALQLGRE